MHPQLIFTMKACARSPLRGRDPERDWLRLPRREDRDHGPNGRQGAPAARHGRNRQGFAGEEFPDAGRRSATAPRSPSSIRQDGAQNVEEGGGRRPFATLRGFGPQLLGTTPRRVAKLAGPDRCGQSWELDRARRDGHGSAPPASGTTLVTNLVGRRTPTSGLAAAAPNRPTCFLGRAHLNHPGRRVRWLARALLKRKGNVIAITHDAISWYTVRGVDPRARSRRRRAWRENTSSGWIEGSASRPGGKRNRTEPKSLERELEWCVAPRARSGKGTAASPTTRTSRRAGGRGKARDGRGDHDPRAPVCDLVIEAKGLAGIRANCDGRRDFILPRGGIVGGNRSERRGNRRTLFRMLVGPEKPDPAAANRESVKLSYVDQGRDSLVGERAVWEELSEWGKDLLMVGKREVNYASVIGLRASAEPTSRRSERPVRRRAQ